ncbi:hypothetical protein HY745_08355 [Candidatus Desantisbacteria bacterium]|nr:hypothetical protein [Candidatus Desantisbacteria bacterium]
MGLMNFDAKEVASGEYGDQVNINDLRNDMRVIKTGNYNAGGVLFDIQKLGVAETNTIQILDTPDELTLFNWDNKPIHYWAFFKFGESAFPTFSDPWLSEFINGDGFAQYINDWSVPIAPIWENPFGFSQKYSTWQRYTYDSGRDDTDNVPLASIGYDIIPTAYNSLLIYVKNENIAGEIDTKISIYSDSGVLKLSFFSDWSSINYPYLSMKLILNPWANLEVIV